jgi:hypothetical protein
MMEDEDQVELNFVSPVKKLLKENLPLTKPRSPTLCVLAFCLHAFMVLLADNSTLSDKTWPGPKWKESMS